MTCLLGVGEAVAQLPQDHEYQVTLRDYLATLTEEDFAVDLQPVIYADSFFSSLDDLHKIWILLEDFGRKPFVQNSGFRVSAEHFVLSQIERDGKVFMRAGRGSGFVDPIRTAWWTTWDYPGNPHYDSRAGKLRAFVASAIDMMMTDKDLEVSVQNRRSDYVGGYLLKYGYVYFVVKDILPLHVQEAYESGLLKFFERLESYYPYGLGGADMESFQLVALWYTAEAIDDDDLRVRALTRAQNVLQEIMPGDGYRHHHGPDGIDLSYEGILQHFLSWAALLYDDPIISASLQKSARLKAYQTLPEPDGFFYGPSHFNTGTDKGSAQDQWHSYHRDHAVAMVTDESKYLIWTGSVLPVWYYHGLPSESKMRSDIASAINWRNEVGQNWSWTTPSSEEPGSWQHYYWTDGIAFAAEYYQDGFYDELKLDEGSEIAEVAFLREENFIETFGDDFLIARFSGYGAIIHTGTTVANWATGVPGLSGGSLSAFWSEGTGSVVLGRSRGTQNALTDTWTGNEGWDTWAVHAISGVNSSGQPFSSARNRMPEVTHDIYGTDSATVIINGAIGQHDNGLSAPNNAIAGQVDYTRTFKLKPDGMRITSMLSSDEVDGIQELWETIPLFLRDKAQNEPDAEVAFYSQGAWVAASTELSEEVTGIRTTRFGQSIYFIFEKPHRMKLSPEVWSASQVGSRIRTVLVDMLDNDSVTSMPDFTFVSYTISPEKTFLIGDPSGNGEISAYDAALILQHKTGAPLLEGNALLAADVSGNGEVSALDASYVLSYLVGAISCFTADPYCSIVGQTSKITDTVVTGFNEKSEGLSEVAVPLPIQQKVSSIQIGIKAVSGNVWLDQIGVDLPDNWVVIHHSDENGMLHIAMAGEEALSINNFGQLYVLCDNCKDLSDLTMQVSINDN